jgi:hypothetical protein
MLARILPGVNFEPYPFSDTQVDWMRHRVPEWHQRQLYKSRKDISMDFANDMARIFPVWPTKHEQRNATRCDAHLAEKRRIAKVRDLS